jgi:hypothetical protein
MVGVKRTLVAAFLIAACIFIVATKPVTSENEKIIDLQKDNVKLSVPSQINYQGYLCNASDTSAYSGTVDMTFRLYDSETDGVVWWVENHTGVEVVKGLFSVNLGENNAIPAPLFDGSIWWLEIVVDGEVLSPRKKLVSVGYSYRSQIADTAYHSVYVDSISTPLTLSDSLYGTVLEVENKWVTPSECQGIKVNSGGIGIAISNSEWAGVWVGNTASHAYSMQSADKCGLYVYDAGWDGVNVVSAGDNGVEIGHVGNNGIFINDADTNAVEIEHASWGIMIDSVDHYGLYIKNSEAGLFAMGTYHGGVFYNNSSGFSAPTLHAVNYHGSSSNEIIASFSNSSFLQFYFQGDGNAYAEVGWNTFKKNSKDKYESFSAVETAHKEIIDHGKGRLSGGETYIEFSSSFSEFVSPDVPVEITVTPVGSYSGIYIQSYDRNGFYVKSEVGDANCKFNWMAIGREKGHEERAEVGNIDEESRKIMETIEKRRKGRG